MTATVTPLGAGTDVGETIGGKLYGRSILSDAAGADGMGLVTATPAANTLLGRLKDIVSTLVAGPKTAATSLSVVPNSDGFPVTVAGGATAAKQDALLAATAITAAPFTITPHASNPLERSITALSVATGGTVIYRHPAESSDRTLTLPAGFFPFPAAYIRTGGTATGLTGF